MDFALTEEQEAIVGLATQILGDRCTPERLKEIEAGSDWFDRDTWNELAKAELLGIVLPEAHGGGGFGFLEACLVLEELGRRVAPLPLWPTWTVALAVARFGADAQQARWLPGVAAGEVRLAPALAEPYADPRDPQVVAEPDGDGWRLTGTKTVVPGAHVADALLVPARAGDGSVVLALVPVGADGLTVDRQDTFSHEPTCEVRLDGVAVPVDDVLAAGDPADRAAALGWIVDRAVVSLCAVVSGVVDAGMRLTAEYVTNRHQFDRPIGSFQAVGHRMADCFVDNEAVRLAMLLAASRLDDEAEADAEVAVAKYWASWSGRRVGHAGLHLHGGISIDLDYPMHRYFLWGKQLEYTLGAATPQLAHLGEILAREPVAAP